MIDVGKEIEKYEMINLNEEEDFQQGEVMEAMQSFQKIINRFGKEQFKTSGQLEEILDALEERDELYNEIKDEIKERREDVSTLIDAMMLMADRLEDIYRYTLKSQGSSWKQQIHTLWEKLGQELSYQGITRIGERGASFSTKHYIAEGTATDADLYHGDVLEILQSGYIYRGKVIRKARVIVNESKERMRD